MIHNDIQNQLQLLIKGSAQPLIEVAESPAETPQWTLGQRLPAHVLASLPNGRFQVQIEEQILDMNLPRNTQPGETLELTYAGNSPRLTFLLNVGHAAIPKIPTTPNNPAALGDAVKLSIGQGGTNAQVNIPASPDEIASEADGAIAGATVKARAGQDAAAVSNTSASGVTMKPDARQSAVPIADAPVVLSDAAKFIGNLQQKNTMETAQSSVAIKSRPVLNAPPDHGKPLAEALSKTLSQSGLFYESHQLQWISGKRSLAMLRQEPQARFSPAVATSSETAVSEQDSSIQGNNKMPELQMTESAKQTPAMRATDATVTPVNVQTLPLVQQQLEVLDSRQIIWQGQVWPGQDMRWEIEEDAHGRRAEEDAPPAWKTRLRLELPRLGGVTANIMLKADGIRVDFSVAQDDSAALLKREQMGLVQSFETAGLSLTVMTVNQDEQAAQA